jgi:hypothetical protein
MIKYFSAIVLIVLIFLFNNCNNSTEPTIQEFAKLFEIHLQGGFSNTPVKVKVDNSQLLNDTVTTGSILAYAAIIPAQINKGLHSLSITIDDSITKDTTFTINDTLYIGVNYKQSTSSINYYFRYHSFPYR